MKLISSEFMHVISPDLSHRFSVTKQQWYFTALRIGTLPSDYYCGVSWKLMWTLLTSSVFHICALWKPNFFQIPGWVLLRTMRILASSCVCCIRVIWTIWRCVILSSSVHIKEQVTAAVEDTNPQSFYSSLLLARQCAMEGTHLFPTYHSWLQVSN